MADQVFTFETDSMAELVGMVDVVRFDEQNESLSLLHESMLGSSRRI